MTDICFVSTHRAAASHFEVFTDSLKETYTTQHLKTGVGPDLLPIEKVVDICKGCKVVITDVGNELLCQLHKALKGKVVTYAYVDNPETDVPGYSETAKMVCQVANGVLFANAKLATSPKEIGIGYYPMLQLAELVEERKKHPPTDVKTWVFIGGNNSIYFDQALPQFLSILEETEDRSGFRILFQSHPSAHGKDLNVVQEWLREHNEFPLQISTISTNDALKIADGVLYHQTSLNLLLPALGLPALQIGPKRNADLLIQNHFCTHISSGKEFLTHLNVKQLYISEEKVAEMAGFTSDWKKNLKAAIEKGKKTELPTTPTATSFIAAGWTVNIG